MLQKKCLNRFTKLYIFKTFLLMSLLISTWCGTNSRGSAGIVYKGLYFISIALGYCTKAYTLLTFLERVTTGIPWSCASPKTWKRRVIYVQFQANHYKEKLRLKKSFYISAVKLKQGSQRGSVSWLTSRHFRLSMTE